MGLASEVTQGTCRDHHARAAAISLHTIYDTGRRESERVPSSQSRCKNMCLLPRVDAAPRLLRVAAEDVRASVALAATYSERSVRSHDKQHIIDRLQARPPSKCVQTQLIAPAKPI